MKIISNNLEIVEFNNNKYLQKEKFSEIFEKVSEGINEFFSI